MDFLNTIATPVDTPVEWLRSDDDLLAWLERAQLLSGSAALLARKAARPGEIDATATQARALREWFRDFVRAHRGKRLNARALEKLAPLNQLLARDSELTQIVVDAAEKRPNEPLRLVRLRRWLTPDALLLPIAQALAQVVCDEDFAYIKQCEGPACSLLYVDRIPTHSRRWCVMAVCGNRMKQAAHRGRKRRRATP